MTEPATAEPAATPPAPAGSRGPTLKQLIIVVVILGVGVGLTALTSDVKQVSEPGIRLVDDGPWLEPQVGPWQGGEQQGLLDAEKAILPPDTRGARRLYHEVQGGRTNEVWASIVLAGKDVTSIHRPEMCLPGQGWRIDREFVEFIPIATAPGGRLGVMRMNTSIERQTAGGNKVRTRAVFAYWFVGKDKTTPHHWQRIVWTSLDRIFHNTNHRWAYIMIHAAVTEDLQPPGQGRTEEETMAMVRQFVQELYPSLLPSPAGAPLIRFAPAS